MSGARALLPNDADILHQRLAASRPCLYLGGLRCDGALHAARRQRHGFPDRHRRARPEGAAAAAGGGLEAAAYADGVSASSVT